MFKKLVTYFLLINFLNTVFFCNNDREDYNIFSNQEEEVQEEEINSIVEYVVEECLDIKDTTPEDEDDDCEDFFKVEKIDKCVSPTLVLEHNYPIIYSDGPTYSFYYNSTFNKVFLEINSPPPKLA